MSGLRDTPKTEKASKGFCYERMAALGLFAFWLIRYSDFGRWGLGFGKWDWDEMDRFNRVIRRGSLRT